MSIYKRLRTVKPPDVEAPESVSNDASNPDAPASKLASKIPASKSENNSASYQISSIASKKKTGGYVQVNIRMDPELDMQIEAFTKERGWSKQHFFDVAASYFLDQSASYTENNPASKLAHDDLKTWKTRDDVVFIYETITGNRFKSRDDPHAKQFNDEDRRIIEISMLQTFLNAKGKKINSFLYFVDEIKNLLEIGHNAETIDVVLRRRREMVEQWKIKNQR